MTKYQTPYCTHNLAIKVGVKAVQCLTQDCAAMRSIEDYVSREDAYIGIVVKIVGEKTPDGLDKYEQRGFELYQLKKKN